MKNSQSVVSFMKKKSQSFSRHLRSYHEKNNSSSSMRNFNEQLCSRPPTSMTTFGNQPFSRHFSSRQRLQRQAPSSFPAFSGCTSRAWHFPAKKALTPLPKTKRQPFYNTYCTVKVCSSSSSKWVSFFRFFFRVVSGVFGSMVNIFFAWTSTGLFKCFWDGKLMRTTYKLFQKYLWFLRTFWKKKKKRTFWKSLTKSEICKQRFYISFKFYSLV